MGFEKVTTEQALQEYVGNLDATGLNQPEKSVFVELMRIHLEEWERSYETLQDLVLEPPSIATGEYLDQRMIDHEWRGPTHSGPTIHLFAGNQGNESRPLATVPIESRDKTKPRENHVRDAVRANL